MNMKPLVRLLYLNIPLMLLCGCTLSDDPGLSFTVLTIALWASDPDLNQSLLLWLVSSRGSWPVMSVGNVVYYWYPYLSVTLTGLYTAPQMIYNGWNPLSQAFTFPPLSCSSIFFYKSFLKTFDFHGNRAWNLGTAFTLNTTTFWLCTSKKKCMYSIWLSGLESPQSTTSASHDFVFNFWCCQKLPAPFVPLRVGWDCHL